MTLFGGLVALISGIAYTTLGLVALSELVRHRSRGFSHMGFAFALMVWTCGPHHLVHGVNQLFYGVPAHGPHAAAVALGTFPVAVFFWLRLEALAGGRGDRLIPRTPLWLGAAPLLMAVSGGAILWEGIRHAGFHGVDLRVLIPNLFLFVNYSLAGLFTGRTQLARRPLLGGWSLSGVAMSGFFLTCGFTHLLTGLMTTASPMSVALDNIGVPASTYFLWAVYRIHSGSLRDWNRRPLVGRSAPQGRRSPWAEQTT